MTMNSEITCRNLSLSYPSGSKKRHQVLDNLNVTFPAGKISVITGAVGSGKSTLLHILAGLMRPTSGEVLACSQAVSRWRGAHRGKWRRQVGMLFQHYHLITDMTVLENIMLPLIPLGYSISECRHRSIEALETVGLSDHARSPVYSLSGGERQKTAMARALVIRPKFLFADEPTAHQDRANQLRMLQLLQGEAEKNAVVILATHEQHLDSIPGKPIYFHLENGTLKMEDQRGV